MESNSEVLRGRMICGEYNDWYVLHETSAYNLHPDDVEHILDLSTMFDNVEARILADPYVDFKIVAHQKLTGVATYAKLVYRIIEQS